jgi:large subunit ribosomal protein L4e
MQVVEKKDAPREAKKSVHARKHPIPKPREQEGRIINVYNLEGSIDHSVELPRVFSSEFRPDLVRRAVTAFRANRRQAYGPSPKSGMRHSVRWSGKGQGVSRVPRIRGTMIGAQAPGTRGGRRAHPPRPETIWSKKINSKERIIARNSALIATGDPEHVRRRGHRFNPNMTLPLIVVDEIEKTARAKDALRVLSSLGVVDDVVRVKEQTSLRAGRGKMRGRRYRSPKSLLLVVNDASRVRNGFGNIPGVEVTTPSGLNAEVLAPGGDPGRLAVFSAGAFEKLRGW